jgi:hypothetical protein
MARRDRARLWLLAAFGALAVTACMSLSSGTCGPDAAVEDHHHGMTSGVHQGDHSHGCDCAPHQMCAATVGDPRFTFVLVALAGLLTLLLLATPGRLMASTAGPRPPRPRSRLPDRWLAPTPDLLCVELK